MTSDRQIHKALDFYKVISNALPRLDDDGTMPKYST